MLVNVKFFKKKFLISFFLLITTSLLANEKDQIIAQLNSLNSLWPTAVITTSNLIELSKGKFFKKINSFLNSFSSEI